MFDAIDTDNEGSLTCIQVEQFVVEFLKGTQKDGEVNSDTSMEHTETFRILRENESGELTFEELGIFLMFFLKAQVLVLEARLEK